MRILSSIIILLITCNLFAQPDSENVFKARAEFRQGMQKGVAKDFQSALDHFNQAINLNPIYAEAFLYRGLANNELGDFENAIKDFTICVELDPKFSDQAHFFRGIAKVGINNYAGAIQDYTTAIQLNPDFIAFFRRGQANMRLNEYARALQDFEIAVRLNPSFIEGIYNRGKALYYLGQYPEAINDLRRASMDLRNNAEAYYYSGIARIETRDFYGAIRDLDKAIEIDPENVAALRARAVAHEQTGNIELANTDNKSAGEIKQPEVETTLTQEETTIYKKEELKTERDLPDFAALFKAREKNDEENSISHEESIQLTKIDSPVQPSITTGKITKDNNLSEENNAPVEVVEINDADTKPITIDNVKPGFFNKNLSEFNPQGFGVQIASYTSTDNLLSLAAAYESQFDNPILIQITNINNRRIYRLIVGEFKERLDAEQFRDILRGGDFPDCFLVVYDRLK